MTKKRIYCFLGVGLAVFLFIDAVLVHKYRKAEFKDAFGVERPDRYSKEEVSAITLTVSNKIRSEVLAIQMAHLEVDTAWQEAMGMNEVTEAARNQKVAVFKSLTQKKETVKLLDDKLYHIACLAEDGGLGEVAAAAGVQSHYVCNWFRHPNPESALLRMFVPI